MKKNTKILIGVALLVIVFCYFFVYRPFMAPLSVATRVQGLSVSMGNHKGGVTESVEEYENLIYGHYYEFVFEVYWNEEGDVVDPSFEDERVAIIQDHLVGINELLWQKFLANETLMEYVYPQYIETKIIYCSDLIQGAPWDFHYELVAESRVQTVCIKNPIGIFTLMAIVALVIFASIGAMYLPEILHEWACIIHGWPPEPPVPPPEGASEELWAKYYEAFKIYSATKTVENLIWYLVLAMICIGLIFVIVYYFSSKAGREKIIKRITGKKKK